MKIVCPFDGQIWDIRTQEQADRFQRHLQVHRPAEQSERVLREALKKMRCNCSSLLPWTCIRCIALATPAPEQNAAERIAVQQERIAALEGMLAENKRVLEIAMAEWDALKRLQWQPIPENLTKAGDEIYAHSIFRYMMWDTVSAVSFGDNAKSQRLAAVKGACARAGGFGKDTKHGYAGRNADAWLQAWEYANACLNDTQFHPAISKRAELNMKELTDEQYLAIWRAAMEVSDDGTPVIRRVNMGRAAYAASFPHAVIEALEEPSDKEKCALGVEIRKTGPDTALEYFCSNRLASLTVPPDPLRKALSRWVSEGDMDEAVAAIRAVDRITCTHAD